LKKFLYNYGQLNKFQEELFLTSSQNSNATHDLNLEDILQFSIQPLVYSKYSILEKENEPPSDKGIITKKDIFILRNKIPVAKLPLKLQFPQGSANQQKKEADENHQQVMKQREFEIEAAMVRVMKTRNRLDWNQLQVEVINSLKNRFIPDTRMLKKRLESLVDRQFMRRDENDPKIIIYIA
jgi:cullin 3